VYGAQWTGWPTKDGGKINQIDYMVDCLKNNPNSRRILFHGWNTEYLPDEKLSPQENVKAGRQALAVCHLLYQAFVADGKLSMQLYIRSSDVFLGLPYNIAGAADSHAGSAMRPDPPRDHRQPGRHPRLLQP
jgi:thymidylate synthase